MEASGQLHSTTALPLSKEPPLTIRYDSDWASAGLDAVARTERKSQPLPGIKPRSSSPSLNHYTDWATAAYSETYWFRFYEVEGQEKYIQFHRSSWQIIPQLLCTLFLCVTGRLLTVIGPPVHNFPDSIKIKRFRLD